MKAYLAVRKWIDRDLSRGERVILKANGESEFVSNGRAGISYLLVGLPLLVQAILEGFPASGLSKTGMMVSLPLCLIIFAFIVWRQLRLLKARSIKSGRYYERRARYSLPPEYANSEDAFLADRRAARRK